MIPRDFKKPQISPKLLGEPKNGTTFLKYRIGIGILAKRYRKTPKKLPFDQIDPINDIFDQKLCSQTCQK